MADWTSNAGMEWNGVKVPDHGRSTIELDTERLGADQRMVDGTLRRHFIRNIKTWSVSWDNLPSVTGGMPVAGGGMTGKQLEDFYLANPGKFRMVLRNGTATGIATPNPTEASLPYSNDKFYICNVMITDFKKTIVKRNPVYDLWNLSVSLAEV